jgi:hypothetical protein
MCTGVHIKKKLLSSLKGLRPLKHPQVGFASEKHVAHRKETFYLLKGDPRTPSVGFASENTLRIEKKPSIY